MRRIRKNDRKFNTFIWHIYSERARLERQKEAEKDWNIGNLTNSKTPEKIQSLSKRIQELNEYIFLS